MIIEIKGKEYQNPNWTANGGIATIRLISDATFSKIAEDFVLENGDIIKQYDDSHNQIGEWHVEGMCSVSLPGEEDGSIETIIKYHVGQISKDTSQIINNDIEEVSDATLELATMYAGFLNNLHDTLAKVEGEKKDEKEMLNGIQETMNLHTKNISNLESVLNALADRVAVLENK